MQPTSIGLLRLYILIHKVAVFSPSHDCLTFRKDFQSIVRSGEEGEVSLSTSCSTSHESLMTRELAS